MRDPLTRVSPVTFCAPWFFVPESRTVIIPPFARSFPTPRHPHSSLKSPSSAFSLSLSFLVRSKHCSILRMSNQTGIKVSPTLAQEWKTANSGNTVRALKISIINESLEKDGTFDINGGFEQDFGIVHENLKDKEPAYFVVRLGDNRSSEWIFLCYVPDVAPIRQKMIYAATRASLTRDLGDAHFTDSIYGTNKSDFTLEGYKKHRASLSAPKPLSERERQLAEIRANEKTMVENMQGGAYRKSHAPGMSFPLTERALAALKKLAVVKSAAPTSVKQTVAAFQQKKVTVGSNLSPASTPLPASPVITRVTSNEDTKEASVGDDEWDDDETKEAKKVETAAEEKVPEETDTEDKTETEAVKEEEEETPAPVEEEPAPAVKQERTINFVKLAIDAENERIDLASEAKITAKELTKHIDEESPRFTFFAFEHTHKGAEKDSLVFMYTCPTKSKIRERMLYSSCRAGVLQAAKDEAGLDVAKKLETTDVSELTETYVLEELYPQTSYSSYGGGGSSGSSSGSSFGAGGARGFSKPARPGARKVM